MDILTRIKIEKWAAFISRVLTFFLQALLVMLLWNLIIPDLITVLPKISYWQALGLDILCYNLFIADYSVIEYLKAIYNKMDTRG